MIGTIQPNKKYDATIGDLCIGVQTYCEATSCGVTVIFASRTDLSPHSPTHWFLYSNDEGSQLYQRGGGDYGIPRENLTESTLTNAEWEAKYCSNLSAINFCTT